MNHPKSFTVDDRGNIYVADTMNMAIRKITDTGITTIAGGKWNRGGHTDGPSEDAKFSNDFEVVYVGSSCSLLVVDRGNQAIREIQLHFDDCAYQYETSFPLGVAVLFAAVFFGYMLALLQRRVGVIVSSEDEPVIPMTTNIPPPYQNPMRGSVRPPLIPNKNEPEKQEKEEEGFFISNVKLLSCAKSSLADIFGMIFRRKPHKKHHQNSPQQLRHNSWPVQESFVIPDEDEPPPVETRTPTPRKTYAFMSQDPEKIHHLRQGQAYFNNWDGKILPQQQQKYQLQQQPQQQQQVHEVHQHRQYSSGPQTFFEQNCEKTNEVVFGAVQEDRKRRTVEIRAINYGDTYYDQYGMRSRIGSSSGFSNGY